jgi:hypothetical protein
MSYACAEALIVTTNHDDNLRVSCLCAFSQAQGTTSMQGITWRQADGIATAIGREASAGESLTTDPPNTAMPRPGTAASRTLAKEG